MGQSAQGSRGFLAFQDTGIWLFDFVDDAHEFEELDDVVGRVNFPPEEPLACAVRVVVVVVVPAFTQSQDGEDEGVAAGFAGFITTATEKVAEGIDGEGGVIEDDGAEAESPEEVHQAAHRGAGHEETENVSGDCQGDRRDEVVFVNEDELTELGEIFDALGVIVIVIGGKDPADVSPVEALLLDGVDVFFLIRMLVMVTMMGSPPKRTFLGGHTSKPSQNELEPARGLIRTMGEVAVVATGNAKFTDQKQSQAEQDGGQIRFHKECRDGKSVDSKKENATGGKLKGGFSHK